jgi:hypothetical protein
MAATITYLDSLSPGMRARLDPAFRIPRQQGMNYVFEVNGTKVDSRQSKSPPPLTRPKLTAKKVNRF